MNSPFVQLIIRWLIMALGVTLATKLVNGISYDNTQTLVVVVVLLSFLNAIIRPLLLLFTLPFIIFTLGLGVLVINALLFLFVGKLVDGFHVAGFWPAVWGALVVSITNLVLSGFTKPARPRVPPQPVQPQQEPGTPRVKQKPDDVIDI